MGNSLNEISQEDINSLLTNIPIRLKLVSSIGKGGQKQVYKAINEDNNEQVVFKVIRQNLEIERIKREIRAVRIINHERIPKVYNTNVDEIENTEDIVWIIEELIEGESLRDALNKKRPFSLREVIFFLIQCFQFWTDQKTKTLFIEILNQKTSLSIPITNFG